MNKQVKFEADIHFFLIHIHNIIRQAC